MDKYRKNFNDKVKPKIDPVTKERIIEPFRDAQKALAVASFVKVDRNVFFDDAYSDILSDLFVTWLKTEPHAQKEREYLYHTAMALGSVKEKLIQYETYGFNTQYFPVAEQNEEEKENNDEYQ
jgi:hypothetical protein